MYQLALNYGTGPMLLKAIAEEEELSPKYLEHIVPPLRAAGLISSHRGPNGGYQLVKPPTDITLRDILNVLEGDIAPVECVVTPGVCKRNAACRARTIWTDLEKTINSKLSSISLADMLAMEVDDGCDECDNESA